MGASVSLRLSSSTQNGIEPLGRYLCNASAHGARAYDAHDGKLIFHGGIMAFAFSDTCVQK